MNPNENKYARWIDCPWCDKKMKDYPGGPQGYYLAWDWYVCGACFNDLEKEAYEDHCSKIKRRKQEKREAKKARSVNPG
jgi:hypothetical protein